MEVLAVSTLGGRILFQSHAIRIIPDSISRVYNLGIPSSIWTAGGSLHGTWMSESMISASDHRLKQEARDASFLKMSHVPKSQFPDKSDNHLILYQRGGIIAPIVASGRQGLTSMDQDGPCALPVLL